MGEILVKLPNETFKVKITGDKPTVEEQLKINNIIRERKRSGKDLSIKKKSKDEQMFDTKSGVRLAGLRATLGLADNAADEVKTLASYDLGEGDYLRNKRGKLAITPQGGRKLGLSLKIPTLIDEVGFSKYDFLDLTGVVPEVVGGVGGALKGAAIGSLGGPIGTLAGSIVGAGLGAGGGQAIEELGETVTGIQGQTFGEVAKDVGKEVAVGVLAETVIGLPLYGLSKVASAFGAGRQLSKEEIEAAGGALNRKIMVNGKEVDVPVSPTLGAVGAPSVIARAAGIGEKIFGTSTRLKNNNESIQKILSDYKSKVGANTSSEEIGNILLQASDDMYKNIIGSQKKAQKAVINQMDDLLKHMGAAASKNSNLDNEALDFLADAWKLSKENLDQSAKQIDGILKTAPFKQEVISTTFLNDEIKYIKDNFIGSDFTDFNSIRMELGKFTNNRDNLSFSQLNQLRNSLDNLKNKRHSVPTGEGKSTPISSEAFDYIAKIQEKIDHILTPESMEALIRTNFTGRGIKTINRTSLEDMIADAGLQVNTVNDLIKTHRDIYKTTIKQFDDMENMSTIKNFRDDLLKGNNINTDDLVNRLIKKDKPESLRRAIDVAGTGASNQSAKQFTDLLAGQWLRKTMTKANIGSDSIGKFNGQTFLKEIENLGSTADVLFGNNAGKVKELARKIGKTNLKELDESSIKQIWSGEKGIIDGLSEVLSASKNEAQIKKFAFLKNISEGKYNNIEAANALAQGNMQASEVTKILKNLNSVDREKLKGSYLQGLIGDFGSTTLTDAKSLGSFAKRLIDSGDSGKLKAFFGEDMAKDMARFGKEMDFVSRTVAGGDLIAANIAASPLQNLGKLLKFSIYNRILGGRNFYKDVLRQYDELNNQGMSKQNAMAKAFTFVLSAALPTTRQTTGQLIDEGINETSRQAQALMDNTGLSQQLSNLQQNIQTPNNSSNLSQVNVAQPLSAASSAGNISPIVVPNPTTRATFGSR